MHVLQRAWKKLYSALDHNCAAPKATPFISLQFFLASSEPFSKSIIWRKKENFIATKYRSTFPLIFEKNFFLGRVSAAQDVFSTGRQNSQKHSTGSQDCLGWKVP